MGEFIILIAHPRSIRPRVGIFVGSAMAKFVRGKKDAFPAKRLLRVKSFSCRMDLVLLRDSSKLLD